MEDSENGTSNKVICVSPNSEAPLLVEDTKNNIHSNGYANGFAGSDPEHQVFLDGEHKVEDLDIEEATEVKKPANLRAWILLIIMAITDFITFASITILSPFFPAEAENKGSSPTEYGIIIGIFELVALLIANVCIKMVSVVSPRILMVGGIVLLGTSTTIFGFLNHLPRGIPYFLVAILLRSLQGAGAGIIDVCSYMVATTEMSNRVSMSIGVLEMAVGMGLTAGPAIGGVLYEKGGFGLPFYALGGITLVMTPINYVLVPANRGKSDRKLRNIFRFLKDLEVLMCIVSITSGGAVLGFLTGILEPHLRFFELSPSSVGYVTITTGAVFALTTPIWGHVCDKKVNAYFLMFGGCVLCTAGLFFLGPFPGLPFENILWLIIVSLILCGLGAAAQSVCPFGLMLRSARRNKLPEDVTTSALISAVHITASNLGCFIGPFVGGLFLDFIGFRNGTSIMVAVQILLFIGLIFTWRRYR